MRWNEPTYSTRGLHLLLDILGISSGHFYASRANPGREQATSRMEQDAGKL